MNKEEVLDFVRQSNSPLATNDLLNGLEVKSGQEERLFRLLSRLEKDGSIVKTRSGRYGIPSRMNLIVGILQVHPRGYGFVMPEESRAEGDLHIPSENMGGAMDGDKVMARTHRGVGSIIKILRRANLNVVGTFQKGRPHGYVNPEKRSLVWPIAIPVKDSGGAMDGDRVVSQIVKWPENNKGPLGRITRRLGPAIDPRTDFDLVLEKHGLKEEFPQKVLDAAESLSAPTDIDFEGRLDLRGLYAVTIDGEDARDFDDAVSLEETGEGYNLGVHIADVSHYVKEGGPIDGEALKRGTSVYLVERAVHMLPERLSTNLCSLLPGEDRLALSVLLRYDKEGRLIEHSVARSVIRSRQRLTYAYVDEALAKGDSLEVPLGAMKRLAQKLRALRMERGALDLETLEQDISIDENGAPVSILVAKRYQSHSIIEEFMISANEAVAKTAAMRALPFIYRVHEEPDMAKVENLGEFLFSLGYLKKRPKRARARLIREALAKSKGRQEERLISWIVLRSLKLARYETTPSMHFGLQATYYCHFTSPIRRYPDLVAHRVMWEAVIDEKASTKTLNRWRKAFPETCLRCSDLERKAQDAERDSRELKTLRYMKERLGEVYKGIVSGVVPYGFYVQLENGAEGLVHVSYLTDDYYVFAESDYALIGERTKKRYRLGDAVEVRIVAVDFTGRTLEMSLERLVRGK